MKKTVSFLSAAMSAMSVLLLIKHGFDYGFASAFQTILNSYEKGLQLFFGWAEPYIQEYLALISAYFKWELYLFPHWKHLLVLIGIYFGRSVWRSYGLRDIKSTIFLIVWGLILAVLVSVGAGSIPFTSGQFSANFSVAAIPIIGFGVYWLGTDTWAVTFNRSNLARFAHTPNIGWWKAFISLQGGSLGRTAIALVLLFIGLNIPLIEGSPSPGLVMLGVMLVLLALHSLWVGVQDGRQIRKDTETWLDSAQRTGEWNIGFAILQIILGVLVVLVFSAGLT